MILCWLVDNYDIYKVASAFKNSVTVYYWT